MGFTRTDPQRQSDRAVCLLPHTDGGFLPGLASDCRNRPSPPLRKVDGLSQCNIQARTIGLSVSHTRLINIGPLTGGLIEFSPGLTPGRVKCRGPNVQGKEDFETGSDDCS